MINGDKRLIVALDFSDMDKVRHLVEQLGDSVSYYKVGMELFYSVGSPVITYLREMGKDVFLDLKLHDIPNTVAQSAKALTRLGVSMFNVHASGGPAMMRNALQVIGQTADELGIVRPKVIAVTVLTSINAAEWNALGHTTEIAAQVVNLAKLTKEAGLDGVVASPQEASMIKAACGEEFAIITPGIRPAGADIHDQSRIATPASALKAGAHHLVVGRPITAATNPRLAAEQILQEIGGV